MDIQASLFRVVCLDDDEENPDVSYVLAVNLSDALKTWKDTVAKFINEDLESEGINDKVSADDIGDPDSINLLATFDQLIL